MPGYKQKGNSCAAYTMLLTLHEQLGDPWEHSTASAIWNSMQFTTSEHPGFAAEKYTNPCKMPDVARGRKLNASLCVSPKTRNRIQNNKQSLGALAPLLTLI